MTVPAHSLLPADLRSFRERAKQVDRENAFFDEDLAQLRSSGYLSSLVPREFGGPGRLLAETARSHIELARYAPSTALAVGMHLDWVGNALHLHGLGDDSLAWLFEDSLHGELFAFAFAEPANPLPPLDSRTTASPRDGGYVLNGVKTFVSLAPAWTRLGTIARDDSDPDHPVIVQAFLTRDDAGVHEIGSWDAVGLRATQSASIRFDDVFVPAERITRKTPVGAFDQFVQSAVGYYSPFIAAVYVGIGERAIELGRDYLVNAPDRLGHAPVLLESTYHRQSLAKAHIEVRTIRNSLEHITSRIVPGTEISFEFLADIQAVQYRAARAARYAVSEVAKAIGGQSYANSHELSRLYRDVQGGTFHAPQEEVVLNTLASAILPNRTSAEPDAEDSVVSEKH